MDMDTMQAITAQPHSDFNFGALLLQAICVEGQLDGEDTVGQEMDPIPPSPIPEPSQHSINVDYPEATLIPPAAERGISDAQRRKQKSKQKRAAQRKSAKAAKPYGAYELPRNTVKKHICPATAIPTSLNALHLPHTQGAYTGARAQGQGHKALSLQDLIGENSPYKFTLIQWDGRTSRPILDSSNRVIGVCCGSPNDKTWDHTHRAAADAMEDARLRMKIPRNSEVHRRGRYPAFSKGVSHGGGQKCPGNLVIKGVNEEILSDLFEDKNLCRMAGFGSSAFATWAPKLYGYYVDHLQPLFEAYPQLKRNFDNSVFPCATVNLGPDTTTVEHCDSANLPFGLCAITALGNFDYTSGGHLVLWDLKLVIEFPPGSTILIPSATLRHSNTVIGKHERRYSFTQYAAGGLFRWVDQAYQSSAAYRASLSTHDKEMEDTNAALRWAFGIGLFSTLESLCSLDL